MTNTISKARFVVPFAFVLLGLAQNEVFAQTGRVRIRNQSDVDIRVMCISADPNVQFDIFVTHGNFKTKDGVAKVPRAIAAFEDLNDKCIITHAFEFPSNGQNVEIRITGDSANGYAVTKAEW